MHKQGELRLDKRSRPSSNGDNDVNENHNAPGLFIVSLPRPSEVRVSGYESPPLYSLTRAVNEKDAVGHVLFRKFDKNVARLVMHAISDRTGSFKARVPGFIPDVEFQGSYKVTDKDRVLAQRDWLAYNIANRGRSSGNFRDPTSEHLDTAHSLMRQFSKFAQYLAPLKT